MIVDAHAHYHPRAYIDALAELPGVRRGGAFAPHPDTDDPEHIQARRNLMEQAGGRAAGAVASGEPSAVRAG